MTTLLLLALLSAGEDDYGSVRPTLTYRQQLMAARREAEVSRRTLARQRLTSPIYSDEQRALCWLRASEALLSVGRIDQAARIRRVMIDRYPETQTAKLVQQWLWEQGY